jgi:acetyltransferase-like isoleucine patch superfamily enzyme
MDQIKRRDARLGYISDERVMEEQKRTRKLMQRFNTMDRSDFEGLQALAAELVGEANGVFINPPFTCDYGSHIFFGKNCFVNYNCTIIDVLPVRFGDNCQVAPNVSIYTAGHPIHPATRNTLYEYGRPVTIGDNVWIGGNVVLCPGVSIGSNSVIGAGSVVTRDIPDWSVAAGNPARVLRTITEEDRKYLYSGQVMDPEGWADCQRIMEVQAGK